MKKRILSCLMALALCLTLLPTAALAAEPNASETPDAAELNGMDNDDTMAAYETRFRRPMTPTRL